jgi:hypothetical protein
MEYTGEEIALDPVVVDETLDWAILKPEKRSPAKTS